MSYLLSMCCYRVARMLNQEVHMCHRMVPLGTAECVDLPGGGEWYPDVAQLGEAGGLIECILGAVKPGIDAAVVQLVMPVTFESSGLVPGAAARVNLADAHVISPVCR